MRILAMTVVSVVTIIEFRIVDRARRGQVQSAGTLRRLLRYSGISNRL